MWVKNNFSKFIFWGVNIFGGYKFCGGQHFWGVKMFEGSEFGSEKNLWSTKKFRSFADLFLGQNIEGSIFGSEKNLWSTKFGFQMLCI